MNAVPNENFSPDENQSRSRDSRDSRDIEAAVSLLRRGAEALISEDELRLKLQRSRREGRPLRVKLGVDPTSPDITLGFAVVLRKLRQFQDLGHEAHLIIGDFTAQIGDPTGKSKTRPQLSRPEIEANARTYQEQLFRILDADKTVIHFNGDWLGKMSFADVIQLAAKYTVAQTLEREDFALRVAQHKPLHLHEILYPLVQGQDSVVIEADVELGGSDQRFNNLVGRELQRANGQEPQVVLLMPLLVGTDGAHKMSKSLGNYIGIGEAPAEMFGKLMSLPDEAMRSYFVLCTMMPEAEIEALLSGHPMQAKKRLGREIVAQHHGQEAAHQAQDAFERQFGPRKEAPDEIPEVTVDAAPVALSSLLRGVFNISGGEARRLVESGAVSIDGERLSDPSAPVAPRHGAVIKLGKRRYARLRVTGDEERGMRDEKNVA